MGLFWKISANLMEKDISTTFKTLIFSGFWNFPPFFPICLALSKEREISKPGKNRGLEIFSNIFFPLAQQILCALSLAFFQLKWNKISYFISLNTDFMSKIFNVSCQTVYINTDLIHESWKTKLYTRFKILC